MKKLLTTRNILYGLGIISITGIARYLYKKRKRKIFVSFHSKNNAYYKNLLNAWQKNNDFDLDFHDKSVGISINTKKKDRIKAGITRKLKESNLVLCIVGESTNTREWINFELEKAQELNIKIIAIKIKYYFKMPECLLNSNTEIINGFKKDKILEEVYKS